MNIYVKSLCFGIVFLCFQSTFGQVKPAVLKIKFENPQRQASVITFENGSAMRRTWAIDSTTTRTDSAGLVVYTFALTRPSQVQIMYFSDSTTLTFHHFFLQPNELLECSEKNGKFFFLAESKASKRNRFLHEIGIFSQDSLRKKPLMRKVSDAIYSDFMQDISEEKWHLYQTTQDTTDTIQNVFVKASLEAQRYFRIQYFIDTKDWPDEMFDKIKDGTMRRKTVFVPNNESVYKIPFRIVPHDEAILSGHYFSALSSYLIGESNTLMQSKMTMTERMTVFYDIADKALVKLPKTREAVLFDFFGNNGLHIKDEEGIIMQRIEKDFPNAPQIKKMQYAYWTNQKAKVGISLPPVVLMTYDKTPAILPIKNGKETLLLIWNTWEDSCQIALESVMMLINKYNDKLNIKTLCVRNRLDSWKEVLIAKGQTVKKEAHFYADYPETAVLEGILGKQRPLVVVIDKEGRYVEQFSPFEQKKVEKWLKQ